MAKDKITVTLDPAVIAETDGDAERAGLNRSEYVESVLRDAHYRRLLTQAAGEPVGHDAAGLRQLLSWQAGLSDAA